MPEPFDGAQFVHLYQPGGFAVAVKYHAGRRQLLDKGIGARGQHHGDAGMAVRRIHGAVPHPHAGHIADQIAGAMGQMADAQGAHSASVPMGSQGASSMGSC